MSDTLFVLVASNWVIMSVTNMMIAKEKGRESAAAFFVSLIASPYVVWAYLLAVPPLNPTAPQPSGPPRHARDESWDDFNRRISGKDPRPSQAQGGSFFAERREDKSSE